MVKILVMVMIACTEGMSKKHLKHLGAQAMSLHGASSSKCDVVADGSNTSYVEKVKWQVHVLNR